MTLEALIDVAVLPLLGVALALSAWRVVRGPTAPDRVVALDHMATVGVGLACALAVRTRQAALEDAVLVIALVSFLGSVAYARYLERNP